MKYGYILHWLRPGRIDDVQTFNTKDEMNNDLKIFETGLKTIDPNSYEIIKFMTIE